MLETIEVNALGQVWERGLIRRRESTNMQPSMKHGEENKRTFGQIFFEKLFIREERADGAKEG